MFHAHEREPDRSQSHQRLLGVYQTHERKPDGSGRHGVHLFDTTSRGFTAAQLYSTQSYKGKTSGEYNFGNDLTGWDFSGQNLTNADLTYSTLTDADLTGAVVTRAIFSRWWGGEGTGITQAQLASTASYQTKNLTGIVLSLNDLTGCDFSGQNLSGASLQDATLTNANLTGAVVTGANLGRISGGLADDPGSGVTKEQLYSTASYQAKNLRGITLWGHDLTGWDLQWPGPHQRQD